MQTARFIPYVNLAVNRFRRVRTRDLRAAEVEVLQAEEVEEVTPPVSLPDALEKVVGVHPTCRMEDVMAAATERRVIHQPVRRHRVDNALVSPDGFWVLGLSERYAPRIYRDALRRRVTPHEEVHYCGTYSMRRYFGHWMMDGLPMMLLAPPGATTWLHAQPEWDHAARYLHLLNLASLRDDLVFAERLHVYEDVSQGSLKKARYAEIRTRIRRGIRTDRGSRRVYLKRGASGVLRQVVNEAELEASLAARGFRIVDVPNASLDDLLEATFGAEVVVGVEGSHLSHAHYVMAVGGVLLALTEPDRFVICHQDHCRAIGTRMAFCMLEGRANGGYRADLDDVLRTLELAGANA